MIDVSELMTDPELCEEFQIRRVAGAFQDEGRWVNGEPALLDHTGVIQPAKAQDILNFLPEGERSHTVIAVYSNADILMADGEGRQSDVVIWDGGTYRVAFSKAWQRHGYWFALAVGFVDG